jgi:hypothetical protein
MKTICWCIGPQGAKKKVEGQVIQRKIHDVLGRAND